MNSTPPPAPSALFAKRARESNVDGTIGGPARYRPPALRTINAGDSPPQSADTPSTSTVSSLPPTNFPPGFRRARAGTLPSNVQLAAAQRLDAGLGQASPAGLHDFTLESLTHSALDHANPRHHASTPPASATSISQFPQRPGLKHATSIASSGAISALSERNSRIRSGSLTLPASGMNNGPFGQALFPSQSWLGNTRGASNYSHLDEIRSVTSDTTPDDYDVPTLDYLGLDDAGRPLGMSDLRAAQAALAGPARLRATTVSNPYRLMGGMQQNIPVDEDELLIEDYQRDLHLGNMRTRRMDVYDNAELLTQSRGYRDNTGGLSGRARAISMGNLDDHTRLVSMQRGGYDMEQEQYESELGMYGQAIPQSARSRAPSVRFPPSEVTAVRNVNYALVNPRSVSPKAEQTAAVQTPSRSLWIGNLDPTFTSEDLIRVFAPYGPIESLRLLPEKECGFVNFIDQADAIRAKDDVLNRLGGMIGMANGNAVRVGFGKPDSAPVAPAKGTAVVTPQGIATPGGATHLKSPGALASPGGMDQLQSSPTRALWIGSIPSTTTPATILSIFSPFGPIESARVLTHKNCGFINFERLDDAVRARKTLNNRDILGADVGAIRIGFARVPTKNSGGEVGTPEEMSSTAVQGIGDLSVGASIHALRSIKGASAITADQQVLSGNVENYRSNLVLSMVSSGAADALSESIPNQTSITEQQMVMKALSAGSPESDTDVAGLADFRPPTMYYTSIPLVSDRTQNKRWDATKLRELRKRLDSGSMTTEEVDGIASDFLDDEIVDLASDWLGNTVVQKLFERCSKTPRFAMLERIAPHLAMIGIHKNGTWAAQKIIETVNTPEEINIVIQHLRAYCPPLLLDQFGNYVVQCCLRFGHPNNDFVFEAMIDRLWEIAQGRFGARSMRACLESNHVTLSQQRRLATAVILNSIPLATNPNGALLLTWLLDTSNFPSRYTLLAPRFTPHLSHLCTHKLASLTVLRLVNQKVEPEASTQVVEGLFMSANDTVLTDVLGDQVNGVQLVQKVLTSPFIPPGQKEQCVEATKRVLTELKVTATQAYKRVLDEVGLQTPNYQMGYGHQPPQPGYRGKPQSYVLGQAPPPDLTPMMANLQLQGANSMNGPTMNPIPAGYSQHGNGHGQVQVSANYPHQGVDRLVRNRGGPSFSPTSDPFNPFNMRSPEISSLPLGRHDHLHDNHHGNMSPPPGVHPLSYGAQSPNMSQASGMMGGVAQGNYAMPPTVLPPHLYQVYYQMYQQQNPQNVGSFQ